MDDYSDETEREGEIPPSRSLVSRHSKIVAREVQDEDGNWRVEIKAQKEKFDEEAKSIFLSKYADHGRLETAATAAGVTGNTVRRHLKSDEDFAEAALHAEHTYRDKLIGHHQDLVFNGTEKVNFDRNGNVVSRETIFPIRLIELELKKHDEGYRDKREVDLNVQGGVLVAPAEVASVDDWEKKFGKQIDGQATVISEEDIGAEQPEEDEADPNSADGKSDTISHSG